MIQDSRSDRRPLFAYFVKLPKRSWERNWKQLERSWEWIQEGADKAIRSQVRRYWSRHKKKLSRELEAIRKELQMNWEENDRKLESFLIYWHFLPIFSLFHLIPFTNSSINSLPASSINSMLMLYISSISVYFVKFLPVSSRNFNKTPSHSFSSFLWK